MDEAWTPEIIETLTTMYADGASGSKIAAAIGKTRSAVIGKAHRLNLHKDYPRRTMSSPAYAPKRSQHISLTSRTVTPKKVQVQKLIPKVPAKPSFVAEPAPPPQLAVRHTIFMISDKTCRFPIGHPGTPGFYFCGHEPKEKSVYCPYHSRIAYQTPEQRLAERQA